MIRPQIRLKCDENLGHWIANRLANAGYDVSTAYKQGLISASDQTLIEVCKKENRCLVTLDLDFTNPILFPPKSFAGIAVLRLPRNATKTDLNEVLNTFLQGLECSNPSGHLWIIRKDKIRVYSRGEE